MVLPKKIILRTWVILLPVCFPIKLAVDHVVAPTPGSAITIPETANEFAIKENHLTLVKGNHFDALFDRILQEIRAFTEQENESLTDAWLRMKEMLRNCHGHNLSKGNIIKVFYHGLSEITQEVLNAGGGGTSNSDTDKIMARMDAMNLKMDVQCKELQSNAKKTKPDLDDDDTPMSREEEAKFMQTFPENMLVEVGKFTFPADFIILEMEEDNKVPLILGRPFLHTADAVIRVKQKQLNLGVGTERMIFNIDYAMKHSYSNDDACFSINVIDEIFEENFDALLLIVTNNKNKSLQDLGIREQKVAMRTQFAFISSVSILTCI
uniref:Reverse transcriptase domain-containing protein n=1 Tax=Tanacetum cinerariifolium TaxID=118510 RepID=A0A6L2N6C2_TANCI|nr:reverse transcriptase domain-containing protein [Tanacetum cinerariifolium]